MPWKVVGTSVVRSDTGKVVHKHPSRKKALAQLRALYANVHHKDYNPNQPRWPKGHPRGGQWRGRGGLASLESLNLVPIADKIIYTGRQSGTVTTALNLALDAIGSVHQVPAGFIKARVSAVAPKRMRTSAGDYLPFNPHKPDVLEGRIRIRRSSRDMLETAIHEIAHHVDAYGFARGLPGMLEGGHRAVLIAKMQKSRMFNELYESLSSGVLRGAKVSFRYVHYLMKDNEMFARGYTQWISYRARGEGGDRLRDAFSLNHWLGYLETSWESSDFYDIAAQFDDIFRPWSRR